MTIGANRRCIISFCNERGNYRKSMDRLEKSLEGNFDGDFLGFIGESTVGAEPHLQNPYSFKIYCIEQAIEAGYKVILWLDSSCFAIKNVSPIFDEIEHNGYIMQEAGCYVGQWCNDYTLNWFGINRDGAMKLPCYGNAGFLGLDFNSPIANDFFNQWKESMLAGCFKGSWDNHRHDLTCGSIIANKLGMRYKKGDEWLQYASLEEPVLNETILIKAQGM